MYVIKCQGLNGHAYAKLKPVVVAEQRQVLAIFVQQSEHMDINPLAGCYFQASQAVYRFRQ